MLKELGSWVHDLHILDQIIHFLDQILHILDQIIYFLDGILHILDQIIHFLDLILPFLNTEFCTANIISAQNLGILSVICRIGSKIFVFKNKHF